MKNLILVISVSLVFILSACERPVSIGCITPEGSTENRVVNFNTFNRIEIVGDADVFITEGPTQEVVVEAATNIIDRLIEDSSVVDEELFLEINGCANINSGELVVRITMPVMEELTIRGDGLFVTEDRFENIENLSLLINGDGRIDLDLGEFNFLSAGIIGDGEIVCTGSSEAVGININGDGDVDFSNLSASRLNLNVRGDADAVVNATDEIDFKIIGDGNIEAFGAVSIQEIEVIGDGNINNFGLSSEVTNIRLTGDGDVEVQVSDELNVTIIGDGEVCYRGNPNITIEALPGGSVNDCN